MFSSSVLFALTNKRIAIVQTTNVSICVNTVPELFTCRGKNSRSVFLTSLCSDHIPPHPHIPPTSPKEKDLKGNDPNVIITLKTKKLREEEEIRKKTRKEKKKVKKKETKSVNQLVVFGLQ